jgi:protein transport protein SEC61 subunit gamma-like protein
MNFNIREMLRNWKRVLKISKKPTFEDWKYTVRICAIGLVLVGVVGFVIYVLSILGGI